MGEEKAIVVNFRNQRPSKEERLLREAAKCYREMSLAFVDWAKYDRMLSGGKKAG